MAAFDAPETNTRSRSKSRSRSRSKGADSSAHARRASALRSAIDIAKGSGDEDAAVAMIGDATRSSVNLANLVQLVSRILFCVALWYI